MLYKGMLFVPCLDVGNITARIHRLKLEMLNLHNISFVCLSFQIIMIT